MKKICLEDLITPSFDASRILPIEEDFKKVADAYLDYTKNGSKANYINIPWNLARAIKDEYKIIRRLIVAALLNWTVLVNELKKACIKLGYSTEELKNLMSYAISYLSSFESYYVKYCKAITNSSNTTAPAQSKPAKKQSVTPAGFYRIVVYDPKYNPPARRHIYLGKKQNGKYKVSIGGSTVTSWYNEPFFESQIQAQDFINNITNANTKLNVSLFNFSISNKPINLGRGSQISNLVDCELVDTDCGQAYIHTTNKYCVESLSEELEEDIEKHNELNPILFEKNKLKNEIKEKCLEIVDTFLEDFEENTIEFKVKDIIITGSNASYNYSKDSDIDIHIVADVSDLDDPSSLYPLIYDAYKSLFNKRLDIKFYDIPVEVYVETQETPLVSNGVYSVQNDEWIKEPEAGVIPEVNQEEINKAIKPWENRYKILVKKIDIEKAIDDSEIEKYITELYKLRHQGLAEGGEYSIENLVFKEIRNKGYLDNLKELKNKIISNKLSLTESKYKNLTTKEITDYRIKISQLTNYPALVQANGLFEIYNVKETDFHFIQTILGRQDFIEYIQKSAEKLDFSKLYYQGIPTKKYKVIGKIKL